MGTFHSVIQWVLVFSRIAVILDFKKLIVHLRDHLRICRTKLFSIRKGRSQAISSGVGHQHFILRTDTMLIYLHQWLKKFNLGGLGEITHFSSDAGHWHSDMIPVVSVWHIPEVWWFPWMTIYRFICNRKGVFTIIFIILIQHFKVRNCQKLLHEASSQM